MDETDDPIARKLAQMPQAQTSGDPIADKLAQMGTGPDSYVRQLHREYAAKKKLPAMDAANAADQAAVPSLLEAPGQALETLGAGVPGGKLGMSAVKLLANRVAGGKQTFADMQNETNKETSDVPYASAIGRAAGAVPVAMALGGLGLGGTGIGAAMGGADEALNNDPNSTLLGRLGRGVTGAAIGGAVGKATDMAGAGVRMLRGKSQEAAKAGLEDARTAISGPAYDSAISGARGKPLIPEMQAQLNDPDVLSTVSDLAARRQWRGQVSLDPKTKQVLSASPEFIDAVFKDLSDEQSTLLRRGIQPAQANANTVRDLKQHIALVKSDFLDAADKQIPGYANAVQGHEAASAPLNGWAAGNDAMARKMGSNIPLAQNVGVRSPGALGTALEGTSNPAFGQGSALGVLGAARTAFKNGSRVRSLWNAPGLLQQADAQAGSTLPSSVNQSFLAALQGIANR